MDPGSPPRCPGFEPRSKLERWWPQSSGQDSLWQTRGHRFLVPGWSQWNRTPRRQSKLNGRNPKTSIAASASVSRGWSRRDPDCSFGPGSIGEAVLDALTVPVAVHSGILSDAVLDLASRGLLLPGPVAAYLAGTLELYSWAGDHPLLRGIEFTHDVSRLARGSPFVAVNTALQIDPDGQVNVESVGWSSIGGIGGHPDFSFAGATSVGGLSIIAMRSTVRGELTLVERQSAPVSTPSHDVDIVVTEHGVADLRGRDRAERQVAIRLLWDTG